MMIDLSNLFMKRNAESRSLSAENFRAEKGKGGMATAETTLFAPAAHNARELGQGWKVSPCLRALRSRRGKARRSWITTAPA